MNDSTFTVPLEKRYFEDYIPGSVHEYGSISVEQEEIISFAKRFDPQVFHTEPEPAKKTIYERLDRQRLAHLRPDDAALRRPLPFKGGESGLARHRRVALEQTRAPRRRAVHSRDCPGNQALTLQAGSRHRPFLDRSDEPRPRCGDEHEGREPLSVPAGTLARMFHELLAATMDMAVLPGVLGCRFLRRTV